MPKKKSAAQQSQENMARTGVGKGKRPDPPPTTDGENGASRIERPVCEKCGQVHRRCRGHTKHGPNAGKPCGANPRTGQFVCIKHGGNHPAQIKSAKQRLLELVDPALAALHRVLTGDADDAVKVRAAVAILDRTGFGPSANLNVQESRWDAFVAAVVDVDGGNVEIDRSLGAEPPVRIVAGGGDGEEPQEPERDDIVDADWFEDEDLTSGPEPKPEAPETKSSQNGPLDRAEPMRVGGSQYDPEPVERYGKPRETREDRLLRAATEGRPSRKTR